MNLIKSSASATQSVATINHAVAIIDAASPPAVATTAISRLLLAFPVRGYSESDMALIKGNYLDAIDGFELPIVMWTLGWLRFNNPRNKPEFTEAPNCQDVRAACKQTRTDWRRWVIDYYTSKDGQWGKPTNGVGYSRYRDIPRLTSDWANRVGGPPGSHDCHIPQAMIESILRDNLSEPEFVKAMGEMPDERFDRIPVAGFPPGVREAVLETRATNKRRKDELAALKIYLDAMDPELRDFRENILLAHREAQVEALNERERAPYAKEYCHQLLPDLTEDELMSKARGSLAWWQEQKAEADANGHEITGGWHSFAGGFNPGGGHGLGRHDLRCVPFDDLTRYDYRDTREWQA